MACRKTGKAFMQTMQTSSELSISEVRILSLASIGGALEFYDFVIFVFFADVIGKLFFAASLPDWVRQAAMTGRRASRKEVWSTATQERPNASKVNAASLRRTVIQRFG
jgi:hypothetical protein